MWVLSDDLEVEEVEEFREETMLDLINVDLVDAADLLKSAIFLASFMLLRFFFLLLILSLGVSFKFIVILIVLSAFCVSGLGGILFEGQVGNVRDRPYQALVIDDLLVLPSLMAQKWKHLLIMQLLETE